MKLLQGFLKLFNKNKTEGKKSKQKDAKPPERELQRKTKEKNLSSNKPTIKSNGLIRKKEEKVYIQVGLDFGTSSTKIVFSQIGKRYAKALFLGHKLPTFPEYCLPSIAAINGHGKLLLGIDAARYLIKKQWDSGFQRIKVIVAGKYDDTFKDRVTENNFYSYRDKNKLNESFTPERLTAVFLAYAMHTARSIIQEMPEYKNINLNMSFNICMPIDHYQNNPLRDVFINIFSWAEAIEHKWCSDGSSFDVLKASYETEKMEKLVPDGQKVHAVPESVAGIASYLVSLRKREGLHAIIDLGAGTSDISICNIHINSDETKPYWYSAKNIPRGTINIERIIADYLSECSQCTCQTVSDFIYHLREKDLANLSSSDRNLKGLIYNELRSITESDDYIKTWGSAYRKLKKQTKWMEVEVFLSGGGALLPYVHEVFSVPWWNQLRTTYHTSILPTPDNYDPGEGNAPFDRMAVAYGLSIPIPQLADYVLPADCSDHTPPPLRVRDLYHEDIYAK